MQLSDPKREIFAQQRAAGKSRSEAARLADFKAFGNMGSRLAKEQQIIDRIAAITKTCETAGESDPGGKFKSEPWVVVELASIHRIAKKEGQYGVCINALLALARIGKLIDSTPGPRSVSQTLNVNGLTPDTLRTILRQNLGALPEAEQKQLSAAAGDILDAELLEPLSTTRAEAAPGESV